MGQSVGVGGVIGQPVHHAIFHIGDDMQFPPRPADMPEPWERPVPKLAGLEQARSPLPAPGPIRIFSLVL